MSCICADVAASAAAWASSAGNASPPTQVVPSVRLRNDMLPQLGTRPSPSRRSPFSPQAGAAYTAAPPPPVTWTATAPRPQTSAGMLERQSVREGNLLSPPTMTYDRPLRDRPLTGQVPRRRPRPSHETDLPSSPRSTIHPAAKVEAWAVNDKAVHEHVDASGSADHENERLRVELQSLQAALQHTQSALVDKYRGSGAKFVGGGQFRGSSENTRSKAGLDKKCGECAAAKALLRKAKFETESLMVTRRTLQADLSHIETGLHQVRTPTPYA